MHSRRMILASTAVQAAGTSTVGRLLAERFVRGVHIEADALPRPQERLGCPVDVGTHPLVVAVLATVKC